MVIVSIDICGLGERDRLCLNMEVITLMYENRADSCNTLYQLIVKCKYIFKHFVVFLLAIEFQFYLKPI